MANKSWDAESYEQSCSFVYRFGADVTELLQLFPGMKVLDLGCGSGVLTAGLAEKLNAVNGSVIGADASSDMLALAGKHYPAFPFLQKDARFLDFDEEFDAVFSNAVFHWIDREEQHLLLDGVARTLKPGGQLVCEFGGAGCGKKVHDALRAAFEKRGLNYKMPFYFPTIGEYAPRMEQAGLVLTDAFLFDRPTPMEGENGLEKWIRMFVTAPFAGLSDELTEEIIAEAADFLRPTMFDGEKWIIDYVRIRLRAVRRAI